MTANYYTINASRTCPRPESLMVGGGRYMLGAKPAQRVDLKVYDSIQMVPVATAHTDRE